MKYKWVWILVLLAVAALLVWWKGKHKEVVSSVEVTFTGNCAVSVDPIDAHTDGTVTFSNKTECTISIAFGTRSGTQPFDVTSIVLAPGESKTLDVHDDADGTYTTEVDCGSCNPSSGSSTPIIKVSPPPPPEP